MELFRLARAPYARDLSGKGAALYGARWNAAGVPMVYTATNRSLAMAEVSVHFTLATLPPDYMMVTLWVPDDVSLVNLDITALPQDWQIFPHPFSTQKVGNAFVAQAQYALMKVPSAVTKGDYNVLINPNHQDAAKVEIAHLEPFPFDMRLFKV
ncbi:MAG: RES domain-containing protein [Bacteroidetes bacterium]|nr:MAG: RES domain-containing protein [Bacteroidota bacterium]